VAQTPLTNTSPLRDFLIWVVEPRYCFTAGTIKNVATAAIAAGGIVPGTPLDLNGTQWEIALAADKSSYDGFFADERKSEALAGGGSAISTKQYRILARGPAIVNKASIPTTDPDAGALTSSDVVTRARALLIEVMDEPTKEEVQNY
jgi:hypothetical protein